jgi:hypothetical protein
MPHICSEHLGFIHTRTKLDIPSRESTPNNITVSSRKQTWLSNQCSHPIVFLSYCRWLELSNPHRSRLPPPARISHSHNAHAPSAPLSSYGRWSRRNSDARAPSTLVILGRSFSQSDGSQESIESKTRGNILKIIVYSGIGSETAVHHSHHHQSNIFKTASAVFPPPH